MRIIVNNNDDDDKHDEGDDGDDGDEDYNYDVDDDNNDDNRYNFINMMCRMLLTCSTAPVLECQIVAPKSNCRHKYCNNKPVTTRKLVHLTLSLFSDSCASLRARWSFKKSTCINLRFHYYNLVKSMTINFDNHLAVQLVDDALVRQIS